LSPRRAAKKAIPAMTAMEIAIAAAASNARMTGAKRRAKIRTVMGAARKVIPVTTKTATTTVVPASGARMTGVEKSDNDTKPRASQGECGHCDAARVLSIGSS
jgi:hypothetical protein